MSALREAAKQALEEYDRHSPLAVVMEELRAALAEEALQRLTDVQQEIEAALEQPEQEPQPCPTCEALARTVMMDQTSHDTHSPQRKPLTDKQIDDCRVKNSEGRGAGWRFNFKGFARAIEQAHGIGGTHD